MGAKRALAQRERFDVVTVPNDLSALILAGGLGTRLRSVLSDRPKVLAEVAGRPFLAYLLDQLARWGLSEVTLCTGYLSEQIERVFGSEYAGLHIRYSREAKPLGTGGALGLAAREITTRTALVLNGDSYCYADLSPFYLAHRQWGGKATLLLTRMEDTKRFGRVRVDAQGAIQSFEEKVATACPGWVNAGLYLIEADALRLIPADRAVSLEQEIFPAWVRVGLFGYATSATLLDIGTPESYGAAEAFLAGV